MSSSMLDQIYFVLKLQGWVCDPNWSPRRRVAHGIYGLVTFSMLLACIGIQLYRFPKQIRNKEVDSLFFSLVILPSQIAVLCHVLVLIYLEPRMKEFTNTFQETEKIAFEHASSSAIKDYHKECHRALISLHLIIFSSMATFFAWALLPIPFIIINPTKNYEKSVTVLTDFDYGLDKNTYFWYIYAFETLEAFQLMINCLIGYFVTVCFCILVKAQLSLLIRSVESARDVFSTEFETSVSAVKQNTVETAEAIHTSKEKKQSFKKLEFMSYILHHQYVFRLMNLTKSILESLLCIAVLQLTTSSANCIVVAKTDKRAVQKIIAAPTALLLLTYFAFLLWFLSDLRASCYRVGFVFYSLAMSVNRPQVWRECLLVVLRSNRREKFPCFVTSSLTFTFFYKALQMIWNYSSLSQSVTHKST